MTDVPEPTKKRRTAGDPRSVAEVIERLAAPLDPRKRTTPAWILRQLRTKVRLQTTAPERAELLERLDRLDPTWQARATITARGLPELSPESTATLSFELSRAARTISEYPTTGASDPSVLARWLEGLWRLDRSPAPRRMPWLALVALWPDRRSRDFAVVLGSLLAGPITFHTSKPLPPIERLVMSLADPAQGMRRFEEMHLLIEPYTRQQERISSLESDLAGTLKRNVLSRAEIDELNVALVRSRDELELERSARSELARHSADAARLAERKQAEAEGRAHQRRAQTAATFGPELRSLAEDIIAYLDRDDPGVSGALRRARDLVDLGKRLEADD